MTKMASHEDSGGSVKSSTTDKVDVTVQSKTDEKLLPIASSIDQHNESKDIVNMEEAKKNIISDVAKEHASIEKERADNVKNKDEHDSQSLTIDKDKQDVSKTDEKQEIQNIASQADPQNTNEEKDIKNEDSKDSSAKGGSVLKRKRKISSVPTAMESPMEESGTRSKRKKLKSTNDRFCWRCHKENVDAHCTACPRSWHRKCIGGMPSSLEKWICGECATILRAENAETRSIAMAQLSVDQLCMLLKHVVERLRDYPGSEPFSKPVDLAEVPNYMDYVVKPMDLNLLESNVRSKLYGSTDAFMADAKWIQHNCIVFNTCGGVYADTSKLTNAAKQIIKVARQEVSEIEACADCYAHGRNLPRPQPSWFIEPCRRPHLLVWAKLKGFPFWPAKAMPRVNSQGHVDVRFFGEHDRAWVSPKDLYLYSEEPPAPPPRKRKSDMDECVREITKHCRKLALMFGQFKFAPPKVQYNPNDPMQIKLMLPNYDPFEPNNQFPKSETSVPPKKKLPLRKRSLPVKGETDVSSKENVKNDNREKDNEATAAKVRKSDTDGTKGTSKSQANLDGNRGKLNKKQDKDIVIIAQNKIVKDVKPKNAKTSPSQANVTGNSSTTGPTITSTTNISTSNKSKSQKMKNEAKTPTENLPKSATPPANESSGDTARVQKRSLLKNIINPKLALSQTENASKAIIRYNTKNSKVYKPKTRMVDKLNAEKALKSISASKENEKLSSPNSSGAIHRMSLLNNKESSSAQQIPEIDITLTPSSTVSSTKVSHTISSTSPLTSVADKSVLLLVVNNGKTDTTKPAVTAVDHQSNKDAFSPATKEVHQNSLLKRESKAKKTFPGKSPNSQITQRPLADANESIQVSSTKRGTSSAYQLLPPEAGPISARLYHSANELARRIGQLMEEAYEEAAQANINGENGTTDNYQATIFFLRMQIEHMKWQHQQQLAELKHNADRTLREMRASLEAEKLRSIEETRREAEEEKLRCIEETKRKQWCAKCGQEALFYCCWNTAYCDYPCQQSHWPTHMRTCSQQSAYTTIVTTSSAANSNPQQGNNTMTYDPAGRVYALPPTELSGIPPSWSTSSLNNKTD